MNPTITHAPRNAMLLGVAATLAGVGALLWRTTRHQHKGEPLLRALPRRPGRVPVWAQASAIVASSASALLLLLREKA